MTKAAVIIILVNIGWVIFALWLLRGKEKGGEDE